MLDITNEKHAHVIERLEKELIIWLGSVRSDNRPHMVPVWFLWDNGTILIFSQPKDQKIRNLRNNTSVMLAFETVDDGEDVVLIEGTASLDEENAPSATMPAYAEKYAGLIARMKWDINTMAAAYNVVVRITPTKFITY